MTSQSQHAAPNQSQPARRILTSLLLLRHLPLATVGVAIWSAATALLLFLVFRNHGFDDPYITYRYSFNLAHGFGFVYNQGERVLSTTTPLFAMLLSLFAAAGADIPHTSIAIGCTALAVGGAAFYALGRAWNTPWAGVTGLLVYPLSPLLVTTLGAETAFYNALLLLGMWTYARHWYSATALLLAAATVTRADGALIAVVLLVHYLIWEHQPIPWRAVFLFLVPVIAWFGWATWYFGSPFPVTLAAKRRQATLPVSHLFLPGLVDRIRQTVAHRIEWPGIALALLGLVDMLRNRRPWLLLVLWCLLYTVAYTLLGVTAYFWYYGPLIVGLVALIALGVEVAARRTSRTPLHIVLPGLCIGLALFPQFPSLRTAASHPHHRLIPYREAGIWLRDHTPPTARVGTLEVGIIGYYARRPIVDFAGLIQPAVAAQLTPTSSYEYAAIWAMHQYQPDYVIVFLGQFALLAQNLDAAHCELQFQTPELATNGGERLQIFHCNRQDH
ncbi:MAG: hypothetical protein NVS4B8_11480 [Herpetosiphon sp.]